MPVTVERWSRKLPLSRLLVRVCARTLTTFPYVATIPLLQLRARAVGILNSARVLFFFYTWLDRAFTSPACSSVTVLLIYANRIG
jgi:hypothetical protein